MKRAASVLAVLLVLTAALAVPVYAADDDINWTGIVSGIVSGFMDGCQFLLDGVIAGLKTLFIPRDDYFPRMQKRLQDVFSAKFGGVTDLFRYLQDRFSRLTAYRDLEGQYVLKFPSDHLLSNYRVDLFMNGRGLLEMIRYGLSGSVVVFTVVYVFKCVISLIKT